MAEGRAELELKKYLTCEVGIHSGRFFYFWKLKKDLCTQVLKCF